MPSSCARTLGRKAGSGWPPGPSTRVRTTTFRSRSPSLRRVRPCQAHGTSSSRGRKPRDVWRSTASHQSDGRVTRPADRAGSGVPTPVAGKATCSRTSVARACSRVRLSGTRVKSRVPAGWDTWPVTGPSIPASTTTRSPLVARVRIVSCCPSRTVSGPACWTRTTSAAWIVASPTRRTVSRAPSRSTRLPWPKGASRAASKGPRTGPDPRDSPRLCPPATAVKA